MEPTSEPPLLSKGTVIGGRFALERELGQGGMGSVWLARHTVLETPCAVKFIHAAYATEPEVRARFDREAKAAAQLRSRHVVQVLDYGEEQGVPYLAMEHLEGEDLGRRLAARGKLTTKETLEIIAQTARALAKAHAHRIVHRDLKPENVFLVREEDREVVKVLDFGIAKSAQPLAKGATRTGELLGTPQFMSPEQAQGVRAIDHRSDLWALAVLTFVCLTGHQPFHHDALGEMLLQILVRPIPMPSEHAPDLPPALDAWWVRATQRDPEARFQSACELWESLAAAMQSPTVARSVRPAPASTQPMHAECTATQRSRLDRTLASRPPLPPPLGEPARHPSFVLAAVAVGVITLAAVGSWALTGDPALGIQTLRGTPSSAPSATPVATLAPAPILGSPVVTPAGPPD